MSTREDGGPAFPAPAYAANITDKGMTLRDYFAGQALTSVLSSSGDLQTYYDYVMGSKGDNDIPSPDAMSKYSYEIADAMIAARKPDAGV